MMGHYWVIIKIKNEPIGLHVPLGDSRQRRGTLSSNLNRSDIHHKEIAASST